MIVARWSIDARFGHKQAVIDSMIKWQTEIDSTIRWKAVHLITGSVGVHESTVQSEVVLNELSELSTSWNKLTTNRSAQEMEQGAGALHCVRHAALENLSRADG